MTFLKTERRQYFSPNERQKLSWTMCILDEKRNERNGLDQGEKLGQVENKEVLKNGVTVRFFNVRQMSSQ